MNASQVEPLAVGDRVLLWGVPGVIEYIARALATEQQIVTVAHGPRIRLRVNAIELRPAP